jgi:signal transduction histidine kinase
VFSRLGLRSRMAVSYVLVSAAAVVLVESALLAVTVPRILSANRTAAQAEQRAAQAMIDAHLVKVQAQATELATTASRVVEPAAEQNTGRSAEALLAGAAPRAVQTMPHGQMRLPESTGGVVLVLATAAGRVLASNPAGAFARDSLLPATALSASVHSGQTRLRGQPYVWAARPVVVTDRTGTRVVGVAYAMLSAGLDAAREKGRGAVPGRTAARVGSLVLPAVLILVLLLPVGALFGLLSTGRLVRRIRRLVEGTAAMADGDLRARVPVSDADEVGRLEQAVNSMGERLDAASQAERRVVSSEARQAERGRIARELHDAISQDLFSAAMLAGGIRKALPAHSELRARAESLERSLVRTMQEMRAMLLELRPIALEDAGLAEALDELCEAYRTRLGVPVSARIDPLRLAGPVEHAVLRVVQEALGNAVRHGDPETIELRVANADGHVAVTVHDDGRGFDPHTSADRRGMGLALMAERVGELGGTLDVVSRPNQGTTLTVLLPAGTP